MMFSNFLSSHCHYKLSHGTFPVFDSRDKRMAYVQMEALSGLPSKDDWDFVYNGYSNAPFIKTNYPHNSGNWSWGDEADQVALVIQFIRRK